MKVPWLVFYPESGDRIVARIRVGTGCLGLTFPSGPQETVVLPYTMYITAANCVKEASRVYLE